MFPLRTSRHSHIMVISECAASCERYLVRVPTRKAIRCDWHTWRYEKKGKRQMGMNTCVFSGRIARRPRSGTGRNGLPYVAFRMVIDERAYDPSTGRYEPVATFIDVTAFGDTATEVGWRLHIGTQVTCECYLRNVTTCIKGTDRTFQQPAFFARTIDVGQQPRHVRDRTWQDDAIEACKRGYGRDGRKRG